MYCFDYFGIVKIKSNKKILDDIFITSCVDEQETDLLINVVDEADYDIGIESSSSVKVSNSSVVAYPNEGVLYYGKKFLGRKIFMLLKNIEGKPTEFYIANSLLKFVKIPLPMIDLPRFSDILNSLLLVKLISKGFTLAHAALVSSPFGGITISAYPDTGKTTTSLLLSKEPGFKALSDDTIAINSSGECYGQSITGIGLGTLAEQDLFKGELKIRFMKSRYLLGRLFSYFSKIPLLPDLGTKLLTVKIDDLKSCLNISKGNIRSKYLFFLEIGKENIIPISAKDAERKFMAICKREQYFFDNNFLLLLYSYFNDKFDFFNVLLERDKILSSFVKKVDAYIIRAEKPMEFAKTILRFFKK